MAYFFRSFFSSPSSLAFQWGRGGDQCRPNEQVRPVRLRGQRWAAPSEFVLGGLSGKKRLAEAGGPW